MGKERAAQPALFYTRFNLEERLRKDHPLRAIDAVINFDFIYEEVEHLYGTKGNVSVPPPVILKLMLLLVLYNVRSERELMATIPERLDWIWFLGLDLDSEVPDHSVLSKARRRWGADVFRNFFERTVVACASAGLVDGKKLFCDSSLVVADASNRSIVDRHSLKRHLNRAYKEMERRLESDSVDRNDDDDDEDDGAKRIRNTPVNSRFVSTTDPESELVRKSKGGAKLAYQSHRGIDSAYGVITTTILGRGNENEAHRLGELIDQHKRNGGRSATTVVADSKYGTNENLIACHDRGLRLHTRPLKDIQQKRSRTKGHFNEDMFLYDEASDTYTCPAGQKLYRRNRRIGRAASEYIPRANTCNRCDLREQCTTSTTRGRSIKRHFRAEAIAAMRAITRTSQARTDFVRRQTFMERSFAQAGRYGFKRARYRGLERVSIQDAVIAAVQNLAILVRHGKNPPAAVLEMVGSAAIGRIVSIQTQLRDFVRTLLASLLNSSANSPLSPSLS